MRTTCISCKVFVLTANIAFVINLRKEPVGFLVKYELFILQNSNLIGGYITTKDENFILNYKSKIFAELLKQEHKESGLICHFYL